MDVAVDVSALTGSPATMGSPVAGLVKAWKKAINAAKPSPNLFDPDKTHDVLFAQRIKSQILTLLKNAISTKGIFDNPMPVALIERTAPGVLNPWADDWSGKMFEFLKPLSRTFILDDGYINGAAYGFEPEYTADLPALIDLEAYHVDTLTVKVAPKTDGILTWLQRTHDEQSAPYCDKVTNKLTIALRRSRVIRNQGNEPLEIELSTRNWLHNSVCFQNLELVGLSDQQSEFLLYDSMEAFLSFLWGELQITDCRVLTGMTAKVTAKGRIIGTGSFASNIIGVEYENPVFSVVPATFFYCALVKGEETQGAILVTNTLPEKILGVAINYTSPYTEPIERTTYYPALLPKFSDLQFALYYPPYTSHFFSTDAGGNKLLTPVSETETLLPSDGFTRLYRLEFNDIEDWIALFPYYPEATGGPYYPVDGVDKGHTFHNFYFYTKGDARGVGLLADDLTLFKNGEIAIIQCELNFLRETFVRYEKDYADFFQPDYYDIGEHDSYINIKVFKRNLGAKIRSDYSDGFSPPTFVETLAWGEMEEIANHQTTGVSLGYGDEMVFPGDITGEIEIQNSVSLLREFR